MAFTKKKKPTGMTGGKPRKKIGSRTPAWIRAIPESPSHGSGTLQKRLWRLVSDFVRIRDWYDHNGRCVATGAKIGHWRDGQAGHYKPFTKCNGILKFDVRNIHLQSATSNGWGGAEDGAYFKEEISARGYKPAVFDMENRERQGATLGNQEVIAYMRTLLDFMEYLPEKPEYYSRVKSLL